MTHELIVRVDPENYSKLLRMYRRNVSLTKAGFIGSAMLCGVLYIINEINSRQLEYRIESMNRRIKELESKEA